MAIEVCSEISPRISFSYDLNQADSLRSSSDFNRDRLDLTLLESDFDFCIGNLLLNQDLSSADELFSNGKILPVEVKKSISISIEPNRDVESAHPDPSRNSVSSEKSKKSLKELLSATEDDQKPQSKSFWQFNRSSSLNCESSKSRTLIRSLHFLSRSNSTGSAALNHPKPQSRPDLQKQQPPIPSTGRSSSAFSSSYRKASTRKNYGNGVGIVSPPLLNLPPPYISKVTVSFFGFGSLFCNGKNHKKKNKS